MSTNYYVRPAGISDESEDIHLGQYAINGFTFRAYPGREVTTYEAWLAQLNLGQIVTEYGAPVDREEMIETASATGVKARSRVEIGSQFHGGFFDEEGRRWLTVEFF